MAKAIPVIIPNGHVIGDNLACIGEADSVASAERVFRDYVYNRHGWKYADGRNTTAICCAALDAAAEEMGFAPEIFGGVFSKENHILENGERIEIFLLIR